MPGQWLKRIRKTGQLSVFNKASAWTVPVDAALKSFNSLALGVQVVAETTEKSANIVVVAANGPGAKYQYYGDTAETQPDFVSDRLHGQTTTFRDQKEPKEIFFAVVFFPANSPSQRKTRRKWSSFMNCCMPAVWTNGMIPSG
jgi:hypothetical protein